MYCASFIEFYYSTEIQSMYDIFVAIYIPLLINIGDNYSTHFYSSTKYICTCLQFRFFDRRWKVKVLHEIFGEKKFNFQHEVRGRNILLMSMSYAANIYDSCRKNTFMVNK